MSGIALSVSMNRKNKILVTLVIVALVMTIVQTVTSIAATAMTGFRASAFTASGERLEIEVVCDSGRPPSLLHALLMNTRRTAWRAWTMTWKVGTTEVTTVQNSLSITVTGTNVQSTAYVDYYIKAVSASDSQKWTKELDKTGASVTVGGAAHENSTDSSSIDTHLGNMGLATDQSQTVDYYIYVKATTTGIVSGENFVAEITETKFDTVEYLYGQQYQATLSDPTEDGFISHWNTIYFRDKTSPYIDFFYDSPGYHRGYIEWNITSLAGGTVTKVEFRYHSSFNPVTDNCYIYAMANQPSAQSDDDAGNQVIYDDVADGTAYLSNNAIFPEVGINKDVGGASGPSWDTDPQADLQAAIDISRSWFALGLKNSEVTDGDIAEIYPEEFGGADPKPTLYVEYESYVASWSWYITPPLSIISIPAGQQLLACIAVVVAAAVVVNALRKGSGKKPRRKRR